MESEQSMQAEDEVYELEELIESYMEQMTNE